MHSGYLGQIGRFAHRRKFAVMISWAVIAIALGFFAPRLEHALSGAMWEVNGSDSLAARSVIEQEFGGFSSQSAVAMIHSDTLGASDPAFQAKVNAARVIFTAESTLTPAAPPQVSPDGHTVMLQAGSLVNPTDSVREAERVSRAIGDLGDDSFTVALTGSPAFWADFNAVKKVAKNLPYVSGF